MGQQVKSERDSARSRLMTIDAYPPQLPQLEKGDDLKGIVSNGLLLQEIYAILRPPKSSFRYSTFL